MSLVCGHYGNRIISVITVVSSFSQAVIVPDDVSDQCEMDSTVHDND